MDKNDIRGMQLDNIRSLIASQIKDARKQKQMTQLELANLLNLDSSTISKYESGARDIPLPVQLQLESILNVNLGSIADNSKEIVARKYTFRDNEIEELAEYDASDVPLMFSRIDPDIYTILIDSDVVNKTIPIAANAIISPAATIEDGNIVFCQFKNKYYLRRMFKTKTMTILESDSYSEIDEYEPIIIKHDEPIEILGVVVGFVSDVSERP